MNRKYTAEEIEAQRRQMEAVRVYGGRTDYDLEYARYRYMLDGIIPKYNDYGHEIDRELAKAYIEEN